jgi:hypothetical protein
MSTAHPAIAAAIPACTARFTAVAVAFVLGVTGLSRSAAQTPQTQDPTRPADVWLAAAASAPGTSGAPADAPAQGLRVLVIGATRRLAVIDGQVVHLGESYQGAKLVGLDAQGARLKTPRATVNLQITPAARKQVHMPQAAPGKPAPSSKTQKGDGQ